MGVGAMGYKVTIEIEPGSAEDRLLHSEGDPAAFLQKLVSRESVNEELLEGPGALSAADVGRICKLDPIFTFGMQFSDDELVEIQDQLLISREAEVSGHETAF